VIQVLREGAIGEVAKTLGIVHGLGVHVPDQLIQSDSEVMPADLVAVGLYASVSEVFDHGLVALSLGFPFWFEPVGDQFRMLVEPHAVRILARPLAEFDREARERAAAAGIVQEPPRKAELFTPLLWCLSILGVFEMQNRWPQLTALARLDARAVVGEGELWRAFTALFLHADLGHLVSNALSGVFAFSAVVTTMGRKRGWSLIALSAVLANVLVAAAAYPNVYHSIGASTGIFAAVGLLTGRALRTVALAPRLIRWRTLFVPAATGLTVLGLYGAGEQNVDVISHAMGFITGAVLGFLFGAAGDISDHPIPTARPLRS
jgi:rhomboid protease GluP